jgi:hypothetical protein
LQDNDQWIVKDPPKGLSSVATDRNFWVCWQGVVFSSHVATRPVVYMDGNNSLCYILGLASLFVVTIREVRLGHTAILNKSKSNSVTCFVKQKKSN